MQRLLNIVLLVLALGAPPAAWAQHGSSRDGRQKDGAGPSPDRGSGGSHARTETTGERRHTKQPASGDIVIKPLVIGGPMMVGGVQVGKPITIGSPVVVGHSNRALAPPPEPGHTVRPAPGAVVAVPVVLVGVAPSAVAQRSAAHASDGGSARAFMSASGHGSAFVTPATAFTPWYPLTGRLMAGMPFPYPEPRRGDAMPPDGSDDQLLAEPPAVSYSAGTFGGLTFAVQPVDAGVYVDGVYVGEVGDHAAPDTPLPLIGGWYRIEVRARRHDTERFEVHIPVGQVMPVFGTMRPLDGEPAR